MPHRPMESLFVVARRAPLHRFCLDAVIGVEPDQILDLFAQAGEFAVAEAGMDQPSEFMISR
jgi:hypothetical protein